MFRFNEPTKEWKERGTGDVRFLRHKITNKVRVLMRAEKTLRVRANHPLTTSLELKPHAGSDRAFTYFTPDWSEDPETGIIEQRNELFAFRFANPESKCVDGRSLF
jgi:Ran-binding protein 1